MATYAHPDGYDDASDDEFDGFEFGDSYSSHQEDGYTTTRHIERDFVPTVSSVVRKDNKTTSDWKPSASLNASSEL